ncbi:phenylacetate--CoA ligase family protein [Priestia flexa]|uniref:phenylacetate--CoA ligase family protein n=1 Tax=Priestia flexa TaxID=86664 RepID=UPI00077C4DD9|nr:phenylacetate--CoA ligase family protein [Priestia flexa]MED4589893.1 phenylacetate--CoA ligase family protein [Priestia flexa]
MNHYFIDVFEKAGSPSQLKPHVIFDHVWPEETLEKHTEISKDFFDQRDNYEKLDMQPREYLNKMNLIRLQELVAFAYKNIPHYNKIYREVGFEPGDFKSLQDFELLPIINKDDLQEIYKQALKNPWVKINHKSRTSGSTGVPLTLINDTNRHRHMFVQRLQMFESMMGANLKDEDWIYSIYYEPFLLTSMLGKFPTFTVGLGAPLPDLEEHIRKIRPAVITGVANRIIDVAKLLPDAKDLGIKLLTTNSETSSAHIRRELSKQLGVPVLDEYSAEELGIIAWEQQNGDYLVAEDTVYVELVNLNDDYMDTVIGTELWNFAMPRIRYAQNDFAEWKEKNPEFGLKRIKRIIGRQDMKIISPQYGSIDPGIISEIFDTTLVREGSGVKEFRLVQKSLHDIRLLIKKEVEISDISEVVLEFRHRFQQHFGFDTELKIEFVDFIPSLGVKKRSIVREFNE